MSRRLRMRREVMEKADSCVGEEKKIGAIWNTPGRPVLLGSSSGSVKKRGLEITAVNKQEA